MSTQPLILIVVLACAGLTFAIIVIAALSRHKKAATGELHLVGAVALVETNLEPEGSVLVRGELWRARSLSGANLKRGRDVRVVGARGHLLEVEPTSVKLSKRGSMRARSP
jgi:membrane-bound serine protease (ClpP class)